MSHTPGPLTILRSQSTKWDEAGDYAILDAEGYIIGEAFMTVDHLDKAAPRPAEANARLWAAAPEMLVACQAALEAIEWEYGSLTPPCQKVIIAERKIKAAIAKSEGKEATR